MMIMGFSVVNVLIQCFLLHTKMMINTKNKKVLYIFLKTYWSSSQVSQNSYQNITKILSQKGYREFQKPRIIRFGWVA